MTRHRQRRHQLVMTAGLTVVVLAISGCGNGGEREQAVDEPAVDEPVSTESESEEEPVVDQSVATDTEEVNPCGPDGDGDVPGPPGEPPADGATPVTLTAVEYAFDDAESSYPAGDYAFTLSNEGAELHEAVLLRILDAEVTFEDLMEMSDEEAEAAIEFVGGAVACPSDTAEPFGVALTSGRYVMACFLPVGSTADAAIEQLDASPHADQGMVVEMTID
jgi:hypothetical protein